ncbi:MAG: DUF362 domain-containing protein [Anaerobacillus sp.]|uniref:DUF362 domain-containing protein n=1 Tax=Anaerobacillus sp. TaxID=1872506 RepID=UPI003919DC11
MLFKQINKLSNVFLKKIDKIEVVPNKCLKVRAVTSSCSGCVDVCPVSSIQIEVDSIEISSNCINCGICTSVCPTNALKWNHPPLIQLFNKIVRLSEEGQAVYIACSSSINSDCKANVVEVPCLGMLPQELWMSIGMNTSQLRIIYDSKHCRGCINSTGEEVFLKQLKSAESNINKVFHMTSSFDYLNSKNEEIENHNRRRFLSFLLEEVKETNTITVKEVLEVSTPLSPFDKFNRYHTVLSDLEEVAEEVSEMKNTLVDRFLDDTVIHTDKRAFLFAEFKRYPELQEKLAFLIPNIDNSCTRCGACAFLCPTDALVMDGENIILATNKCVSCGLCEEICYEKHIHMNLKKGLFFKEKFVYLL